MRNPFVRYRQPPQVESLELAHCFERGEPGVGELPVLAEVKVNELGQLLQMGDSRIADLRLRNAEFSQPGELGELGERGIVHKRVR